MGAQMTKRSHPTAGENSALLGEPPGADRDHPGLVYALLGRLGEVDPAGALDQEVRNSLDITFTGEISWDI